MTPAAAVSSLLTLNPVFLYILITPQNMWQYLGNLGYVLLFLNVSYQDSRFLTTV